MFVYVLLQGVAQIAHDLRMDRKLTIGTVRWLAVFFAYAGLGLGVLLYVFDLGPALAGALFLLFWNFEGVLWLVRLAPRLKELPHWLGMKLNLIDAVLLSGVLMCLAIGLAGKAGLWPMAAPPPSQASIGRAADQ